MSFGVSSPPPSNRSPFLSGQDLTPGQFVRCIADGNGTVRDDEQFRLVTDQTDRKGNRLLVNTGTGEGAYASPTSVWSK